MPASARACLCARSRGSLSRGGHGPFGTSRKAAIENLILHGGI